MIMADFLWIKIDDDKKPKCDKNKKIIFLVCDTAIRTAKGPNSKYFKYEVGIIQGKKNKKVKTIMILSEDSGIH